jgi:hypothetical protein
MVLGNRDLYDSIAPRVKDGKNIAQREGDQALITYMPPQTGSRYGQRRAARTVGTVVLKFFSSVFFDVVCQHAGRQRIRQNKGLTLEFTAEKNRYDSSDHKSS